MSRSRHRRQRLSPQDKLVQEKVKAERLKREKLEADLPLKEPKYIRLDDLPPLHPDDVEILRQEYYTLAERVEAIGRKEQIEGYIEDWATMDMAIKRQIAKYRFGVSGDARMRLL